MLYRIYSLQCAYYEEVHDNNRHYTDYGHDFSSGGIVRDGARCSSPPRSTTTAVECDCPLVFNIRSTTVYTIQLNHYKYALYTAD